ITESSMWNSVRPRVNHRISSRGHHDLSSPVLRDRTHLDRTAQAGRGNARGKLDCGFQIVGFEYEVTTDRAAGIDVRAVGDLRTAIAYAHRLRVLRQTERKAGRDAGDLVDLSVFRVDPLLLLLWQRLPGVGAGQGSSTLIDHQHELHCRLLGN